MNGINIIEKVEDIISGEKLLEERDIKPFNTIRKPFLEVEEMKIPLIQYCIMKKAIKCFKFLLVNGFDDPNNFYVVFFFFFDTSNKNISMYYQKIVGKVDEVSHFIAKGNISK